MDTIKKLCYPRKCFLLNLVDYSFLRGEGKRGTLREGGPGVNTTLFKTKTLKKFGTFSGNTSLRPGGMVWPLAKHSAKSNTFWFWTSPLRIGRTKKTYTALT